jgi:hypothetical protein
MTINLLVKSSMAILVLMIFIIPQSFFQLKLPFLGVVLTWFLVEGFRCGWKIRSKAFLPYYLMFCLLSMIWCVIGFAKGNSEVAIMESLRVYVGYMAIYCALTIYVSNIDFQSHTDGIVIAGGLGIGLVALVTLVDQVFQMDLIPQFIKDEMFLQVGLHDGYVQINNVNIGMLTFILPYLLSRLMLSERKDRHALVTLGLIVSMAAALIASRRVVMVLIFITPLLIFTISILSDRPTNRHWRWWSRVYLLFLLVLSVGMLVINNLDMDFLDGFIDRLKGAFDTDPDFPRPLQHAALLSGFYDNFFWGSGFGGVTEVVRSDERPWTFELTYSRLLFNGGLIGFGLLLLFYFVYLILVLRKIRQSFYAPIYISMLTGLLSVFIASASNPYLSSFDFLFALSIIPLILNSKDKLKLNHQYEKG